MFRNLFKRFRDKEGGEWQVLLLSLLLAFSVWFIFNMSAEYSAFMEYELYVKSELKGHTNEPTSSAKLVLRAKASGFAILKNRLSDPQVSIVVSPSLWVADPEDVEKFSLGEDALKEILPSITGDKVRLEYFVTGNLSYIFPAESFRKVPVVSNFRVNCDPQYMVIGDVEFSPDSVLVYGPEEELARLRSVGTEPLSFRSLRSDKDGVVSLQSLPGLRCSDQNVKYSVKVSRYVEMEKTVALEAVDVPDGVRLIMLPSKVKVVYRVPFPYRGSDTDFSVGMDYKDFQNSEASVPLRVFSVPDDVLNYKISPSVVDVILKE